MSGPGSINSSSEDGGIHGFEALLVAHQHRIYFFIRSMVFNPEDARDLLQDVNAIIIRKRKRFAVGTDFKSWAFAIARFECLAYLRRYEMRRSAPLHAGLLEYLADGAEGCADDIDPWLEALAECRRLLPEESVELLTLRYQTRVPLEEIARLWKTTEGALKQKLFRVRNQLKACIMKRRSETGAGESG